MRIEGQIAAEMLLERIENGDRISRRERILDCELIVRESSGSKR
jgi:DNA-binding LacI/PurR family transcriptional regulator